MIAKILSSDTGEKSIVLMDSENTDYVELYLEGAFELTGENEFQEGTRIELNKWAVKSLVGYLQNWLLLNP